jgi:hypothetical protein
MGINQTRQQHMVWSIHMFAGAEALNGFTGWQDRRDSTLMDRERVVLQNAVLRFDWNDPACCDEEVDAFHAGVHFQDEKDAAKYTVQACKNVRPLIALC